MKNQLNERINEMKEKIAAMWIHKLIKVLLKLMTKTIKQSYRTTLICRLFGMFYSLHSCAQPIFACCWTQSQCVTVNKKNNKTTKQNFRWNWNKNKSNKHKWRVTELQCYSVTCMSIIQCENMNISALTTGSYFNSVLQARVQMRQQHWMKRE